VRECSECGQAIAVLEGKLAQFGTAYREWGAAQPSSAPIALVAEIPRRAGPVWLRIAAAAALLALAAIQVERYQRQHSARVAAEDEALLLQIHAEVGRSVPSSMATLADLTSTAVTGSAQ